MPFLAVLGLFLLALTTVGFALSARAYRRKLYFLYGKKLEWPIRASSLEAFDPLFARDACGPLPERCEVQFLGTGDGVGAGTSDLEAWVLTVLAKRALNLFEFGTCTGHTTYLWARNSPAEARVVTVTLAPEQIPAYQAGATDSRKATLAAIGESHTTRFRYTGTPVEAKVTQLFSDSKAFDETPYLGSCDLIFVDGSHAFSYCKSDTEKALRMLKPGGIVLWHDYTPLKGRATIGVYQYLNELARTLPLVRLNRTTLVAYRSPG